MHSVTCHRQHGKEGWVLRHETLEGLAAMIVFHMVTAHPKIVSEILAEEPVNKTVLQEACLALFR